MKIGIMYTDFTNTTYKYVILSFTSNLYKKVIDYITSYKNTNLENINTLLLFYYNYLSYYGYRKGGKADIYQIRGLYLFDEDIYYKIRNPIRTNIFIEVLSEFERDMLANNFFRESVKDSWRVLNNTTRVKDVINDDQFDISLVASKYYYSFQFREFVHYKFF